MVLCVAGHDVTTSASGWLRRSHLPARNERDEPEASAPAWTGVITLAGSSEAWGGRPERGPLGGVRARIADTDGVALVGSGPEHGKEDSVQGCADPGQGGRCGGGYSACHLSCFLTLRQLVPQRCWLHLYAAIQPITDHMSEFRTIHVRASPIFEWVDFWLQAEREVGQHPLQQPSPILWEL